MKRAIWLEKSTVNSLDRLVVTMNKRMKTNTWNRDTLICYFTNLVLSKSYKKW